MRKNRECVKKKNKKNTLSLDNYKIIVYIMHSVRTKGAKNDTI